MVGCGAVALWLVVAAWLRGWPWLVAWGVGYGFVAPWLAWFCWLLLWPSGLLLAVVCGRAVGFGLVACEGYCLVAMFRYSMDLCHCTWLWLCSLWFAVALLPW